MTVRAQDAEALNKLRLAQELENNGDWEHAVVLYEGLYRSDPANFMYFDGLRRTYTQLKEYDRAVAIIEHRLRTQPKDIVLMSTLAGLQCDAGREAAADSIWMAAIAADRTNIRVYYVVAAEMIEHRLYDKAVQVYLDGRAVTRSEASFADELATLYLIRMQYAQAVVEWLKRLRQSPDQLPFVQSRLVSMISRPEALRAAIETVETEVQRTSGAVGVRRLLAWLYIEEKAFAAAFEQERMIDEQTGANGSELFSFGQRMLQEQAYPVAAQAFRTIVQTGRNLSLIPQSRFGYARAIESLSALHDSSAIAESGKELSAEAATFSTALRLYQEIADASPNSDLAAQSLFRIGVIKMERFWDLTAALSAFEQVKRLPGMSNLPLDAVLKAGEVLTAQNNLVQARAQYQALVTQPLTVYQDQAVFRLAELDYFEGEFDSSLAKLARFKTYLQADLANDALQLQYFILENKSSAPSALAEFARADLLQRQRKSSEALALFTQIVRTYPFSLLVDDALMRAGDLDVLLNQYADAVGAFRLVADSMQTSIWRDRAQYRLGELYELSMHDAAHAIDAYEQLLVKFPNSLYAEEARRRIRLLRGDAL